MSEKDQLPNWYKFYHKAVYNIAKTYTPASSFTITAYSKLDQFMTDYAVTYAEIMYTEQKESIKAKKRTELKEGKVFHDYVHIDEIFTPEFFKLFIEEIEKKHPYVLEEFTLDKNIQELSELLDLSHEESLFFQVSFSFSQLRDGHMPSYVSINYCLKSFETAAEMYAVMLEIPTTSTKNFLRNSSLIKFKITEEIWSSHKQLYRVSNLFTGLLGDISLSIPDMEKKLFPNNLKSSLTVDHYKHHKDDIDIVEQIINVSMDNKTLGTNIMFYGLPGTGKTELAIALADKNKWKLVSVGDIDEENDAEQSRAMRLLNLKLASKIYKNSKDNVVLLFDEMEDIFKSDNSASFSKAFLNRIIETTTIPIIWTSNSLRYMEQSVLRRMTMNIEFGVPKASARKDMWKYESDKHNLNLTEKTLESLSETYDIVPSMIHTAAKIGGACGVSDDKLSKVIKNLDRLVNYGNKRKFEEDNNIDETLYNLDFVNADVDVRKLSSKLMTCKPNFSLCMYGPPGTGKSAYGRHLAKMLGKKVLFKRASDLVSMWVGETEKNIATAFAQAKEEEKVLIIDEADTFLRSRALAKNSWEISAVNEMLTQMEYHNQPFICTTNLMGELDEASLRRFTFKIKMDFLKEEQLGLIFNAYFGHEMPKNFKPGSMYENTRLTPGDFSVVLKKATIMNETDPNEIVKMLLSELDAKPQSQKRKIGF